MGQILPVMRGSSMAVITAHSLPGWRYWGQRRRLKLSVNQRAAKDPAFAEWLTSVRDGTSNEKNGKDIRVPAQYLIKLGGRKATIGRKYREQQEDMAIQELIEQVGLFLLF